MAEENDMGAMRIDIDLVRQLAAVLDETRLTEVEVQDGERRVRVAREVTVAAAPAALAAAPVATAPAAAAPASAAPAPAAAPVPTGTLVKSPMVGTAYLSPAPGAKPFVEIGQAVKAGQTLLIIEAMKTMNPIEAPIAGTIKDVVVQSGQAIEYDQPLVVIE